VRVATFNVFSGRSAAGDFDQGRFRDAVASLDADLLGLQEVDRGQPRSGGVDLTAVAVEAMGAVAQRFAPALAGTPDRWRAATGSEPDDDALYGIAFLSRYPVRTWRVLRPAPARCRVPRRSGRRLDWARDEPRVAILAQVDAPRGVLDVVTTHLSYLRPSNRWQLRSLIRQLGEPTHPRILLGDLNLRPRPAHRITGLAPAAVGRTFPAERPREQIDHILTGPGLTAVRGRAVRLPMSDHRALLADF
jgi:endonuclease/exonuclease/phosphatase family metal-dependent hydrolase